MRLISSIIIIAITATFLQSCSSMNKQTGGTLAGGAAGAFIGSRFGKGGGALLATGIGALAGALIGGAIGKNMDDKDRAMAAKTTQQALEAAPTGQTITWKNPDNGHSGTVIPTRTFVSAEGENCREYTNSVEINGDTERVVGQACRQGDGSWKIKS